MEADLKDVFNALGATWKAFNQSIAYDFAKGAMLVGVGWLGRRYWGYRKNKAEIRAIRDEDYTSRTASITQIAYIDTKQIISETEHTYILQWQNRLGRLNVEDPFDDKIKHRISQYIDLAIAKCTHEKPVVFQHLIDVVPKDDYAQVRDAIRNYWRYYFSASMAMASEFPLFANLDLKSGYEPEKEAYIPVMVYDPDSTVKELRILWLTENQVLNDKYVSKGRVVIERPNSLTINNKPSLDNADLQWVDLYNNTLLQLRTNTDVIDLSRVGILTGKQVKIPKLDCF